MNDTVSAFELLQQLARQSLAHARQLPAQLEAVQQWSGVGFSLLGHRFVMSMNELTEMLEVPPHTRLPGVRPWVRGVANVRGRLLPLFDLAAFLSGSLGAQKKHHRLLVIEQETVYAGLWVDQVFGMQHFDEEARMEAVPDVLPEALAPFVDGAFRGSDEKPWVVFSALHLSQNPGFLDVARARAVS